MLNFFLRVEYPFPLGENKLMKAVFGYAGRRDDFNFVGCHNDARLGGAFAQANLIGKWERVQC